MVEDLENRSLEEYESCIYSTRLLDKLTLLNEQATNKIDIVEIKKAIYYARKYHGDQRRQSGEPYYSHPLEVAYLVSDYLFRADIIITAILHDTIEDTDLTYEMIRRIFGELVANQVMDLTRVKEGGNKITSAVMVEGLWQAKKYNVLMIKMFDRLHNMQTIGVKSPEKMNKILDETLTSFIVLASYLEISDVRDKLSELCIYSDPRREVLENISEDHKKSFLMRHALLSPNFQNEIEQICNLLEQEAQ